MYYINLSKKTKERYDIARFCSVENNILDVLSSYFLGRLNSLRVTGYYRISIDAKRPDLISYKIYGDVQYWWLVMHFNNILDPNELVVGLTLKYPSLASVEDLYFSLKSLEKANE
jgi:hypothetical protein